MNYQHTQLPPEVFNRLPANIKAMLKSYGAGPGKGVSVLAPTGSRIHYPRLSIYFERYQEAYQRDLGRLFRRGPVVAIFREEHEFTMGIGVGPIPSGPSGKVLGVIRLGGPMGAALGVRENVQLSLGTPVSGYDLDVVDEYQWLIAAGRIPSGS